MAESLSWRLHPYTRHKEACAVMLAGRDGADEVCSCGLDDLLYAEIGRLAASEQEAARLREALRFYAEIREYNSPGGSPPDEAAPIMGDRGMRARRALGLPEALGATTAPEAERAGPDGGAG
jgi:hypothetical protein